MSKRHDETQVLHAPPALTTSAADTDAVPAGDNTIPRKFSFGRKAFRKPVNLRVVQWSSAPFLLAANHTLPVQLPPRAALGITLFEIPHVQLHSTCCFPGWLSSFSSLSPSTRVLVASWHGETQACSVPCQPSDGDGDECPRCVHLQRLHVGTLKAGLYRQVHKCAASVWPRHGIVISERTTDQKSAQHTNVCFRTLCRHSSMPAHAPTGPVFGVIW